MISSKSTKRALLTSALAILMCVAMLVGATFAWFTDTASTGSIESNPVSWMWLLKCPPTAQIGKVQRVRPLLSRPKTIEPPTKFSGSRAGTYELPQLRVVNKGNLALKYKIQIARYSGRC